MPARVRLPSISFVVARSYPQNIIGRDNKLPWHQRTDLQRFKQITNGHVVLMGRNTFDSIGRPLPGRTNVVLSRRLPNNLEMNIWDENETSLLWSQSKEDALFLGDIISLATDKKEIFVIGGEQMYALYGKLCNRLHLTQIFVTLQPRAGDAKFEYPIDLRQWKMEAETEIPAGPHDDYPSRYEIYDRKFKTVRYVELEDYFTDSEGRQKWLSKQLREISDTVAKGAIPHQPDQLNLFQEEERISA